MRKTSRVLAFLGYSLIGLWMLKADPLGFDSATSRLSESIINHVVAPHYGADWLSGRPFGEDSDGPTAIRWNRHITVLKIDDSLFKDRKDLSWPLSPDFHADVIEDLFRTYRPNVILIDILFVDRRTGQEEAVERLANVLARIDARQRSDPTSTKVFLASNHSDPDESEVLKELKGAAELVTVRWSVEGPSGRRAPNFYPLSRLPPETSDRTGVTPAFAIYRHLCETMSGPTRREMHCPDNSGFVRNFRDPMKVFWGSAAPNLNWEQANRGIHCRVTSGSTTVRSLSLFGRSLGLISEDNLQTCPYAQTIKVRDFVNGKFRSLPDVTREYRRALGDPRAREIPRIVIYGASLLGMEDWIVTPTHGQLAGVHIHAMALDNLLTMGGKYIRLGGTGPWPDLIEYLLVFTLVAISFRFPMRSGDAVQSKAARPEADSGNEPDSVPAAARSKAIRSVLSVSRKVSTRLVTFLISFSVIAVFVAVSFFVFRLSVLNWIGFLGVYGVIDIVLRRRLEPLIEGCVEWVLRRGG